MKTFSLCAALLLTLTFNACQKDSSPVVPLPSVQMDTVLLCHYENYYYYVVNGCYSYMDLSTIQLQESDHGVVFTISNHDHAFTLTATPVTADSAVIESQQALDERTGKTDAYVGGLRVKGGVLTISLTTPGSSTYRFFRSDPMPGVMQRDNYVGTYTARFLYNNQMATHTMRILPGNAPDEVVLKNVQGYGLTIAGRVLNGKIETQTTAMNPGGDSLSATTGEIRGNVLSLDFIKKGPSYNPSSPSSSGAVTCFKGDN